MSDVDAVGGVLCAGFGTRMRPLTESVPKPLLPFLNTPILTYALDHFASAGIERVAMNLHHLPDTIPPVADRLCGQFGLKASYSREWDILGTAGGIRGLWHALGEPDATLIVTNGDSVMNIDLADHLRAHRASGAGVSLVVRPKADRQPGGVWLDEEDNLAGIRDYEAPGAGEGERRQFDFTGIHLIEPAVLSDIPMESGDIIDESYGPMIEEGADINTTVHEGFWSALDNPGLLMETTRRMLDEPELFDQSPLAADRVDREGIFVADPQVVDEEAELVAPVFVGPNASVGAGAKVGPYAVIDGVELTEGAEITEAVVYGAGELDESMEQCVAVADRRADI